MLFGLIPSHPYHLLLSVLLLPFAVRAAPNWEDESNVRIPRGADGAPLSDKERIRLLELKLGGHMNWARNPRFGMQVHPAAPRCKMVTKLCDETEGVGLPYSRPWERGLPGCLADRSTTYDHPICLDSLPSWLAPNATQRAVQRQRRPHARRRGRGAALDLSDAPAVPVPAAGESPCLVYDFGIRQQPEFGIALAKHAGCEVHGFDPSPVALQWFAKAKERGELPSNYHFHPYGAGGVDGTVTLSQYDWDQVRSARRRPRTP